MGTRLDIFRDISLAALVLILLASCAGAPQNPTETRLPAKNFTPTPDDRDADTIPDGIEDELAQRFAPVVRLHPDDIYRPANIPWYLTRVKMGVDNRWWFDSTVLRREELDFTRLSAQVNLDQSSGLSHTQTGFFLEQTDKNGSDSLDDYRERTRAGTGPSGWVGYVHVRPAPADHAGMYDIQYIFFYGYNGDIGWSFLIESGHEADFEHITVRVEPDRQTIHHVYFAAHEGEGRWYEKESAPGARDGYTLTADGRPVVYSALNSHACYPWCGEWDRKWNFNDFMSEAGPRWDLQPGITNLGEKEYPRPDMEWLQYSGRWGEVGEVGWATAPFGPAYQEWWHNDPPEAAPVRQTSALSLNSGGIILTLSLGLIILGGLAFGGYRLGRRLSRRWVTS